MPLALKTLWSRAPWCCSVLTYLTCLTCLAKAPAAPARQPQPQATAGDYVVKVTQISRSRSATTEFGPGAQGIADPSSGAVGFLSMQLEVTSKTPNATLRVGGLTGDIVAVDDAGTPVDIRSAYLMGAGPLAAALMLSGNCRVPNAQSLRMLGGELLVYPSAHRAKIELPWPQAGEVPKVSEHGVKATLKKATQDGAVFKIQLRIEVVDGVLGADDPWGWSEPPIRLLDPKGDPITVGDITYQQAPADATFREYSLELRGVSTTPSRIAIDVLARMGKPFAVPFRFRNISLPDYSPSSEADAGGRNPYLDPLSSASLISRVLVRGEVGREGVVLHGLSRLESPGVWGPWRWMEVATDGQGVAVLENIRPGRYRVSRQWRPQRKADPRGAPTLPDASAWTNGRVEVELLKDRPLTLRVLELK